MKIKRVCFLVFMLLFLNASLTFCQEQTTGPTPAAENKGAQEPQWVWAEVLSVDAASRQMTVKYLDYEADTEKEMVISADDKTTFENANSLEEIKPQDTVSIDYIVSADGQNIARNINVEKPEGMQPMPQEATPAAQQAQGQPVNATAAAQQAEE